jgi:hypothetical protein
LPELNVGIGHAHPHAAVGREDELEHGVAGAEQAAAVERPQVRREDVLVAACRSLPRPHHPRQQPSPPLHAHKRQDEAAPQQDTAEDEAAPQQDTAEDEAAPHHHMACRLEEGGKSGQRGARAGSAPAEKMVSKVGSAASDHTESLCMVNVWRQRCWPMSHTLTVPSLLPDTHRDPSALTPTHRTLSVCPLRRPTCADGNKQAHRHRQGQQQQATRSNSTRRHRRAHAACLPPPHHPGT